MTCGNPHAVPLSSNRDALRGSFGFYRAFDAQNVERQKAGLLTMPVLAISGALSVGEGAGVTMKAAAHDMQTLVIPDCGHWVAEEAPEDMLAALTAFLAHSATVASNRSRRQLTMGWPCHWDARAGSSSLPKKGPARPCASQPS